MCTITASVPFGRVARVARPVEYLGAWRGVMEANIGIRKCLILVTLIAVGRIMASAQDDHSQHAHPAGELGTVDFPTSCNASAQKGMSRGVALLHSFAYEEARLAFN